MDTLPMMRKWKQIDSWCVLLFSLQDTQESSGVAAVLWVSALNNSTQYKHIPAVLSQPANQEDVHMCETEDTAGYN